VFSQIARGRSNYEIATALVISEGTVKMHVSNPNFEDENGKALHRLLIPVNTREAVNRSSFEKFVGRTY
jgi:FixJ family two-component response regulator